MTTARTSSTTALPDRTRQHFAPSWGLALLLSLGPVLLGIAFALALHFWIAPLIETFYAKIVLDIGIAIILAVSLNIVNGLTGQFSIGHAGFMAIGGYTAVAITYYGSFLLWGGPEVHGGFLGSGQWLFVGACLAGGLAAACAGLVVGLPSLRLRGDYLAIVTLGFGEIVRVLLQRSDDVLYDLEEIRQTSPLDLSTHLGGALGFSGAPFYTNLFWVYIFVAITLLVAYRLKGSTYGRALLAIRENEIAAEAMGVNTTYFKVLAFVISALLAGIAGGLFAHEVGVTLNPRELGFQRSLDFVIMVVLGGSGSISGSILAAAALTILPELLRNPPHAFPVAIALMLLLLAVRRGRGVRPAIVVGGICLVWEGLRALAIYRDVALADYRMVLYALVLIIVMIVRPQGLLGIHELWDRALWRSGRRSAAKAKGAP